MMRLFFLPGFLLLFPLALFSQIEKVITIPESFSGCIEIVEKAKVYEDKTGTVDFKVLREYAGTSQFKSITSPDSITGLTSSSFWLKMKLKYQGSAAKKFLIEAATPTTQLVELYKSTDMDGSQKEISGNSVALKKRSFQHRKPMVKLELQPQKKLICQFFSFQNRGLC